MIGQGTYVLPTLIELESIGELKREIFGPVLHVVRFSRPDLGALLAQIAGTGYGLTMGLHTRIDETIREVAQDARVGNLYINRNMVGAVVGVQPFGGEGLSGTGPKAGGPLYLYRLLEGGAGDSLEEVVNTALPGAMPAEDSGANVPKAFLSLLGWLGGRHDKRLLTHCQSLRHALGAHRAWLLTGPTGEQNVYRWLPREGVLCLAESEEALLLQLAAALAGHSHAIWPLGPISQTLRASLPNDVQDHIALATDWSGPGVNFDVALFDGGQAELLAAAARMAERDGPIVSLRRFSLDQPALPMEALVVERATSTNTAAAGGNASLMTIA